MNDNKRQPMTAAERQAKLQAKLAGMTALEKVRDKNIRACAFDQPPRPIYTTSQLERIKRITARLDEVRRIAAELNEEMKAATATANGITEAFENEEFQKALGLTHRVTFPNY